MRCVWKRVLGSSQRGEFGVFPDPDTVKSYKLEGSVKITHVFEQMVGTACAAVAKSEAEQGLGEGRRSDEGRSREMGGVIKCRPGCMPAGDP